MNFSIHIDDSAAKDLGTLARRSGKTRNALITEALHSFLDQRKRREWPKAVKSLAGADKRLVPFENQRRSLKALPEDPLS